jgi:hypothetical protein
MLEWFTKSSQTSIVTIYPSNFTLNTCAASHFQEVRYCMIGLDREKYFVALKPITSEELDLQIVPTEQLHKVSIGKGYARVCNKVIIGEIEKLLDIKIDGIKFNSAYNEKDNMLLVNLKDRI